MTERELSDAEVQYIAYKKSKEFEYAKPYLDASAEQKDESALRAEVRDVICDHLPDAERLALAQDLSEAREKLFDDDDVCAEGPMWFED